jgi:MoaA/NifB/PqqE/SkfB family radical SAM enzyme
VEIEDIGFFTLSKNRVENIGENLPMWRALLVVTNRCNFQCPYCKKQNPIADMGFDYTKYVIDLLGITGLKYIQFTGGEPTVNFELPRMVEYCSLKADIPRISLSTNGSAKLDTYLRLFDLGINDFTISLDAPNSALAKQFIGSDKYFERIIDNIKRLSALTYVATTIVINEKNINNAVDIIQLAHDLGAHDIRINSSAQYNKLLSDINVNDEVLSSHPNLKYRLHNASNKRNIRGNPRAMHCYMLYDDCVVAGEYHYPCYVYMREGGAPVGKVSPGFRRDRINWLWSHCPQEDPICRKYCLDALVDLNLCREKYLMGSKDLDPLRTHLCQDSKRWTKAK